MTRLFMKIYYHNPSFFQLLPIYMLPYARTVLRMVDLCFRIRPAREVPDGSSLSRLPMVILGLGPVFRCLMGFYERCLGHWRLSGAIDPARLTDAGCGG